MTAHMNPLRRASGAAAAGGSGKSELSGAFPPKLAGVLPPREAPALFPQPRQKLTPQEERLYSAMVQNIGHRFTYDELVQIAGSATEDPKPLVAVLVCRIRRKLPNGLIIEPWWKHGFVTERRP